MKRFVALLIMASFCLGVAGSAPAQKSLSSLVRPVPLKVHEKVISWHQFQVDYPGTASYFHGNVEYGSGVLMVGQSPDYDVTLFAPIDLPAGSTITKVTSYWRDNDAYQDLIIEVREHFLYANFLPHYNVRMDVSSSGTNGVYFGTTVWKGSWGPNNYDDDPIDGILGKSLDVAVTFPQGIHESVGLKSIKIEYIPAN